MYKKILWANSYKKALLLLVITFTSVFFRFSSAEETHAPVPNDVAQSIQSAIIVHPKNKNTQLTLNQARAIFSLRVRQWTDGSTIHVIVLRDQNPIHIDFLKSILKILPHQLRRHWDRYIYSGIGQGPTVVNNQQDMISMVNQLPGAIGYIEQGGLHEQVNILPLY